MITHDTTAQNDQPCTVQGDDIAAEYDAYVSSQQAALTAAITDARNAVHHASRALFELIELDALPTTYDADDAAHALRAAGREIRAAERCIRASA